MGACGNKTDDCHSMARVEATTGTSSRTTNPTGGETRRQGAAGRRSQNPGVESLAGHATRRGMSVHVKAPPRKGWVCPLKGMTAKAEAGIGRKTGIHARKQP